MSENTVFILQVLGVIFIYSCIGGFVRGLYESATHTKLSLFSIIIWPLAVIFALATTPFVALDKLGRKIGEYTEGDTKDTASIENEEKKIKPSVAEPVLEKAESSAKKHSKPKKPKRQAKAKQIEDQNVIQEPQNITDSVIGNAKKKTAVSSEPKMESALVKQEDGSTSLLDQTSNQISEEPEEQNDTTASDVTSDQAEVAVNNQSEVTESDSIDNTLSETEPIPDEKDSPEPEVNNESSAAEVPLQTEPVQSEPTPTGPEGDTEFSDADLAKLWDFPEPEEPVFAEMEMEKTQPEPSKESEPQSAAEDQPTHRKRKPKRRTTN